MGQGAYGASVRMKKPPPMPASIRRLLKVITFGLSALFMGAAGAALATRVTYIDPGSAFNINYSFFPVMMAIFGGMTNLYGQLVGAAVFAYLEE